MLMVVACSEEIENNTEDPKIDIPENPSEKTEISIEKPIFKYEELFRKTTNLSDKDALRISKNIIKNIDLTIDKKDILPSNVVSQPETSLQVDKGNYSKNKISLLNQTDDEVIYYGDNRLTGSYRLALIEMRLDDFNWRGEEFKNIINKSIDGVSKLNTWLQNGSFRKERLSINQRKITYEFIAHLPDKYSNSEDGENYSYTKISYYLKNGEEIIEAEYIFDNHDSTFNRYNYFKKIGNKEVLSYHYERDPNCTSNYYYDIKLRDEILNLQALTMAVPIQKMNLEMTLKLTTPN